MKLTELEEKVLRVLAEGYHGGEEDDCFYFRGIVANIEGIDEKMARRACRSLAKKGLAKFQRGLFDDEGKTAGSGYCCVQAGFDWVEQRNMTTMKLGVDFAEGKDTTAVAVFKEGALEEVIKL